MNKINRKERRKAKLDKRDKCSVVLRKYWAAQALVESLEKEERQAKKDAGI